MMLLTIGRLAVRAGISRTALLYYEAAGLLRPAARSAAGYRLYGESEIDRLQMIRRYREAGVTVHAIRELIEKGDANPATLLHQRLLELKDQIDALRAQQRLLAQLLAHPEVLAAGGVVTKVRWVKLLTNAGFTDTDMADWHQFFEASSPHAHTRFLQAVGIPQDEIDSIKSWSRLRNDHEQAGAEP